MASHISTLLLIISIAVLQILGFSSTSISGTKNTPSKYDPIFLNRTSFPSGFIFGTASSSYQYEGAWKENGKGASIWDTFTHKYPGRIADRSNGDVTDDQYHRYKEDVGIMKKMNMDAYRFSISWSRLLPNGKVSGGVNKEGIKYYNKLINELIANGMTPFVTIFHWDLPQPLQDEYGGFLSHQIVDHFKDYADVCFKEFGDRVKHWITLNEPWSYTMGGYMTGMFPPARCSTWQNLHCLGGDSSTEPYLVSHNLILSHASAVKLYKDKYQAEQKGVIGITLVTFWYVPYSNTNQDKRASLRALDFMFGWFMDPLVSGNYPRSMRSLVGNRLPKFTRDQAKLVKGSFDFLGLNYYTANYAAYSPSHNAVNASYFTDQRTNLTTSKDGVLIGPPSGSAWLHVYPRGFYDLLQYTKRKYNNPLIYITENGISEKNNSKLTLRQALSDNYRIDYYFKHLDYLRKAINDGVNVKGFFAWSLMDNFEWNSGFTARFGIHYVDYNNGLKRYPKHSANWFKNILKK